MPANATLYLPTDNVDLIDIFPAAQMAFSPDGGSSFQVHFGEDSVVFNRMPKAEMPRHLHGFLRYIESLDEEDRRKRAATAAIRMTRSVLGLKADVEFADNHAIWASLFKIADKYDGYVFTHDSLLLPNGAVIVGPLKAEPTHDA